VDADDDDKPGEESCSSRRCEKEKALGGLVDFDFDLHLRFNSIYDSLLDALLHLGYGTHRGICPKVLVRPRSSLDSGPLIQLRQRRSAVASLGKGVLFHHGQGTADGLLRVGRDGPRARERGARATMDLHLDIWY